MKKRILMLMAAVLFIASNLFAANGDLIVDGNVGIKTSSPSTPVDIGTTSPVKITPEGYLEMGTPDVTGYLINIKNSNGVYYANPGRGGQGYYNDMIQGNVIEMGRGMGTIDSPQPVWSNSHLFSYDLYAQYDTTPGNQVMVGRFGAQMTQATDPDPNKWTAKAFFHMDTVELGYTKTSKVTMPYGNVGIGTTNPGYKLHVEGDIYTSGYYQGSDERFKKDIKTIASPLNKIINMRGVSYRWKEHEFKEKGFSEGMHYGVLAQEVERVLPEIVKENSSGDKSVAYTEMIPVLIEAIKEQQKIIETQNKDMNELKTKVQKLEAKDLVARVQH